MLARIFAFTCPVSPGLRERAMETHHARHGTPWRAAFNTTAAEAITRRPFTGVGLRLFLNTPARRQSACSLRRLSGGCLHERHRVFRVFGVLALAVHSIASAL